MLATLRTAAPLVSRTTFRAFASKTDHKVQTLLELKDVENFRKENAKSVLYFTAVCIIGKIRREEFELPRISYYDDATL